MRREAWGVSARLAWQRPRFRALALLLFALVTAVNIAFLLKTVVPVRTQATAIIHYTIYLGIDDVRDWPWIFLWPAVWQGMACAALIAAFGAYQRDHLLAYALVIWTYAWSVPWAIGLSYLFLFNSR